ncbi:MAG: pilus assembly protein N-terminal domain-containing protein [Pseudolabrys sp.]
MSYAPGAAIGLMVAVVMAGSAHADTVRVHIDKSHVMRLPERAATVVIGNPLIADATLQNGGVLVLTGKGYGATNLVALDRAGRAVRSDVIEVVGPGTPDLITVYRGTDRETYSCAPKCEPRITLGDAPTYFTATIGQTGTRNGSAAPATK